MEQGPEKLVQVFLFAEEMRAYYKHINSPQKILIIASPNVKENFKIQLFDSTKIKKNKWSLEFDELAQEVLI